MLKNNELKLADFYGRHNAIVPITEGRLQLLEYSWLDNFKNIKGRLAAILECDIRVELDSIYGPYLIHETLSESSLDIYDKMPHFFVQEKEYSRK